MAKKGGANQGPARRRYTAEGRLEKHKVGRLMKFNGLTKAEAELLWQRSRTRSRLSKAPKPVGGVIGGKKT